MAGQKSAVDIYLRMHDQATAKFKAAMGGIRSAARGALNILGDFRTMLLGLGAGWLAKSFLDTAASFETFSTQLRTVSTSAREAEESFAWIKDFAKRTPYELEKVTEAFIRAKAQGLDPRGGILQAAGDAASAMGKDLIQAVEAVGDAMRGENERLKEFGIKAKTAGDTIKYTWVDALGNVRETIAKNNPKIIEETLKAIWNERYAGGMEKLSRTWSGMWSNLKDTWTNFQARVMDSGPFQALKGGLQGILAVLKRFEEDGTMKRWAERAGQAILWFAEKSGKAFAAVVKGVASIAAAWHKFVRDSLEDKIEKMQGKFLAFSITEGFMSGEAAVASLRAELAGVNEDLAYWQSVGPELESVFSEIARGWNEGKSAAEAAAKGQAPAAAGSSSGASSGASAAALIGQEVNLQNEKLKVLTDAFAKAEAAYKEHLTRMEALQKESAAKRMALDEMAAKLELKLLSPEERVREEMRRTYAEIEDLRVRSYSMSGRERIDALTRLADLADESARAWETSTETLVTEQEAAAYAIGVIREAQAAMATEYANMTAAEQTATEQARIWRDSLAEDIFSTRESLKLLGQDIKELAALNPIDITVSLNDQVSAEIDRINAALDRLHARGVSASVSSGSSTSMTVSTGDIYVQGSSDPRATQRAVQDALTETDWRTVAREYVAPELGRAARR